ncbi:MAG: DUF4340 domain-containing protein [Acidobacteria bacterium]|nr:DUF4340 domain-containing protein [Acidobacteriota bacterium]
MRIRGLIIATALLAVLAGVVWWSNKNKKDEEAGANTDLVKLLALTQSDIAKVEIRHRDAETTRIELDANAWKITSPEALPADADAIAALVSAVATLNADKVVDEKPAELASFGLLQPASIVTVSLKDGKTRTLKLGDDAPVGGGAYTQVDGDARVFTIASFTKTNIDKLAVDLRDKRILPFDSGKLTRIELTAKGSTLEFSRNAQSEWAIVKPAPVRADNWAVEELLRKLRELKMDPLLTSDQKAELQKQFAAAAPLAAVAITTASGEQMLEVRKTKDNKFYAHSTAVDGYHLLTEENGKGFDKPADDFRNKKLFDFGFNDPNKVEFRDASRQLAVTKSGEKWLANLKPMDNVGVQSLIDRLRELSASSFPATGYTTPLIEITVTAKSTEKVSISKSGDKYIARREGEPALYQLEAKAVEDLQKAAADIKAEQKPTGAKK